MTRGSQTIRLALVAAAVARRPSRVGAGRERGARARGFRALFVDRDDARVAPGQPERDETGDAGAQRPDPEGAAQPEQLDEHEARKQGADDRAHRVRRIESPERLAERRRAREMPDEGRERGAHHDRGRRQGEDREDEAGDGEHGRALDRRVDAAVDLVDEPERHWRDQHHDDERELQQAVHAQRRANAVGDPPADGGPDRHPAEEPGEDGRHGLRGVPEHEDELAGPDDLVDESGCAGQDEDGKHYGTSVGHRRSLPCRGGHVMRHPVRRVVVVGASWRLLPSHVAHVTTTRT